MLAASANTYQTLFHEYHTTTPRQWDELRKNEPICRTQNAITMASFMAQGFSKCGLLIKQVLGTTDPVGSFVLHNAQLANPVFVDVSIHRSATATVFHRPTMWTVIRGQPEKSYFSKGPCHVLPPLKWCAVAPKAASTSD